MTNLQDRASLLAAIEAKRSRKLFRELIIHLLFFVSTCSTAYHTFLFDSFYMLLILILFLQRDVQACHDINAGISVSLFSDQIDHDFQV